jgi:hypothetical protein
MRDERDEFVYVAEDGSCSSYTRSAKARPYAERMDEYRWIKTLSIPSKRAISQACCPPAPPKVANLYACVIILKDGHILLTCGCP